MWFAHKFINYNNNMNHLYLYMYFAWFSFISLYLIYFIIIIFYRLKNLFLFSLLFVVCIFVLDVDEFFEFIRSKIWLFEFYFVHYFNKTKSANNKN